MFPIKKSSNFACWSLKQTKTRTKKTNRTKKNNFLIKLTMLIWLLITWVLLRGYLQKSLIFNINIKRNKVWACQNRLYTFPKLYMSFKWTLLTKTNNYHSLWSCRKSNKISWNEVDDGSNGTLVWHIYKNLVIFDIFNCLILKFLVRDISFSV